MSRTADDHRACWQAAKETLGAMLADVGVSSTAVRLNEVMSPESSPAWGGGIVAGMLVADKATDKEKHAIAMQVGVVVKYARALTESEQP
ncbi:hypothetical protein LCGC14_1546530 [marine sediment metagenome]|uniref:Uncharacterized protein n=1 Tax=marine sediment metagenome TaxID=412755 RepID=A0A0F9IRF8_9ZZZZ